MEDIIKDEVFGELKYQKFAWVKRMDIPFLNSNGNLVLGIHDANKEGILDVQREAYNTYLQNEERYKNCVTDLLLDYYKWNYESIARNVSGLPESCHKDVIKDKDLYSGGVVLWYLFICRDGSFGYAFGCCWDKENGIAVLLSESEPRVISRTQLENLHKLNDPTVGLLVHDGKNAWKGLEVNKFFGKPENLEIELEGGVDDGITPAQQKAYADYLERKDQIFHDFSKMMLTIYMGDEEQAEKTLSMGIPVAVKTILPKTLYIDRDGNYGWICYTEWDGRYIDILLSKDRPYIMENGSLRGFSKNKHVIDKEMGVFFDSYMGLSSIVVVRIGAKIYTLPFDIRIKGGAKVIVDEMRQSYRNYQKYCKTFWKDIPGWLLGYYQETYEDLEERYELPEQLQMDNITDEGLMTLLDIKKLYMNSRGRMGWLAEYPTAQDGLAFEILDKFVDMIPQTQLI